MKKAEELLEKMRHDFSHSIPKQQQARPRVAPPSVCVLIKLAYMLSGSCFPFLMKLPSKLGEELRPLATPQNMYGKSGIIVVGHMKKRRVEAKHLKIPNLAGVATEGLFQGQTGP